MSAVAELNHARREFARQVHLFEDALAKAAMQNFKLKQEVTGGMQIIAFLASQCPDRTLTIKASDLIIQAGSLRRWHDAATDVYHFQSIPPSDVELTVLKSEVERLIAVDAAMEETPPVAIGEPEPTDDVPPVALDG